MTLSAITGDGTLGITLAAGTASDTVGNTAAAAGPSATFTVVAAVDDFGDAPAAADTGFAASYPTLLADNGARHIIPSGGATLFLGAVAPDSEADGQPQASATGDDTTGTADEEGVALPNFIGGRTVIVAVTVTGVGGKLSGWIDWNRDGDWGDAGEQVFTNVPVSAGVNNLAVTVPVLATTGTSFARFRLSTATGLTPTGEAPDGEVEDYRVTLANNAAPVAGTDSVTRSKGRTVKVLISTLLANDTDVDGPSALTLTGVNSPSANGATVRLLGNYVVYEADAGDANDSFTYTVSDGTATSVGTVNVTAADPAGVTLNIVLEAPVGSERQFTVAGIPGRAYKLQSATVLTGPWSGVVGVGAAGNAAANGALLLRDVAPPGGSTFYRVIEP